MISGWCLFLTAGRSVVIAVWRRPTEIRVHLKKRCCSREQSAILAKQPSRVARRAWGHPAYGVIVVKHLSGTIVLGFTVLLAMSVSPRVVLAGEPSKPSRVPPGLVVARPGCNRHGPGPPYRPAGAPADDSHRNQSTL